jgi:hypothetical protein
MRRREGELAVGSLCKPLGKVANCWGDSNKILRIAKRRRRYYDKGDYFVVGVGDDCGYGVWVHRKDVRPLNPLELLAMQAE